MSNTHRSTDPACLDYRPPRSALGRWWHDRQRGKACGPCSALGYARSAGFDEARRLVGTLSAHVEPLCAAGRLQCEECQAAAADPWSVALVNVHNHGPAEGRGLDCPEYRQADGTLRGACQSPEPTVLLEYRTTARVPASVARQWLADGWRVVGTE